MKRLLFSIAMLFSFHVRAATCGDYTVNLDGLTGGSIAHAGVVTPLVCTDVSDQDPQQVLSCVAKNSSNCLEDYVVFVYETGEFWIAKNQNPQCDAKPSLDDVFKGLCN